MTNYSKTIALIGTVANAILTIIYFMAGKFDYSIIWLVATLWAFSNFICELNLSIKEKQIENLLEELNNKNNERTAV